MPICIYVGYRLHNWLLDVQSLGFYLWRIKVQSAPRIGKITKTGWSSFHYYYFLKNVINSVYTLFELFCSQTRKQMLAMKTSSLGKGKKFHSILCLYKKEFCTTKIFFLSLFACSFSHNRKLLNISAGIGAMLWLRGSGVTQQAALPSVSCVEGPCLLLPLVCLSEFSQWPGSTVNGFSRQLFIQWSWTDIFCSQEQNQKCELCGLD